MYPFSIPYMDELAHVENGKLCIADSAAYCGRLLLKGGRVVDPKNNIDDEMDIAIVGDTIAEVAHNIPAEKGDRVIDCGGLYIFPGLMDMHLHLCDLFEANINPIHDSARDGVTFGFSPGAGNTFMAPALLGAEVDRGLPMNLGVYLGGAAVCGTSLSTEELIAYFKGELSAEIASQKLSRNHLTNTTGSLIMGIKDHHSHYIQSDANIEKLFAVTSEAKLMFMSHTQDPTHILRMKELSKGRPFHLGHASIAGCGSHMDPVEGMKIMLDAVDNEQITAEFISSNMRYSAGSRESLLMPKATQEMAYEALASGKVEVLISDGQNNATMKGGGDTRDNLPAILELAEMGVLTLQQSVATMTSNVAKLFAKRTDNNWWTEKTGHIGVGALANLVTVDPQDKLACCTIVNGEIVAFENRIVPRGLGAGGWMSKHGMSKRTGVGDLTLFTVKK